MNRELKHLDTLLARCLDNDFSTGAEDNALIWAIHELTPKKAPKAQKPGTRVTRPAPSATEEPR